MANSEIIPAAQLLSEDQFLKIQDNNYTFDPETFNCDYPLIVDILNGHYIRYALTTSLSAPAIYVQQLWNTLTFTSDPDDNNSSFTGDIDDYEVTFTLSIFRKILHLRKARGFPGKENFDELSNEEDLFADIMALGYGEELHKASAFKRSHLTPLWYTLFSILNRCLTSKHSGIDTGSLSMLRIFQGIAYNKHYDYAKLIWNEMIDVVHDKGKGKARKYVPFQRFLQLIISDLLRRNADIPRRANEPTIPVFVMKYLRSDCFGNSTVQEAQIPDDLLAYAEQTAQSVIAYRCVFPPMKEKRKRNNTTLKKQAQPAEHGENMLGSKKRVCRPEDKDYHEEVVKSSHNKKKKHTVLIDDDSEEELLDFNTEKCGLVENVSPKSACKVKKTFPFTTEISKLTKDAVVRRCQHKEKTITVDDPPLPSKFVAEGKGNRKRKNTPSNKQEFVLIDDDREEEFLDLKTEKWESVENVSPKTDCLEPPLPEKVLSPESGITCVRGYNVKNNIATILEAIFKKHGDIAAKSIFKIGSVRTSFLEVVCKVVMRIQTDNITTIISEMNEIDSQVSEAEAANIDVSWIRAYLADIGKTKAAMENSTLLTEMKANTSLVKTAAQMDLKESREELISAQERFEKAERCVKVLDLVEKKLSYNILESKAKKDTWVKQPIL